MHVIYIYNTCLKIKLPKRKSVECVLDEQYVKRMLPSRGQAMEFLETTHELLCLSGLLYLADYLPFWRWVVDPYGCEIRGSMGAVLEKRVNDFHMKNIDQEHRRERERKRMGKAGDR